MPGKRKIARHWGGVMPPCRETRQKGRPSLDNRTGLAAIVAPAQVEHANPRARKSAQGHLLDEGGRASVQFHVAGSVKVQQTRAQATDLARRSRREAAASHV